MNTWGPCPGRLPGRNHILDNGPHAPAHDTNHTDITHPSEKTSCLDAITIDSFTAADPESVQTTLHAWVGQFAPVPDIERDQAERELYSRVRTATSCYRFAVGPEAQHDWGDVMGLTGFHEFVFIDRRAGILVLVAASDD
jgi:hypothetical protein